MVSMHAGISVKANLWRNKQSIISVISFRLCGLVVSLAYIGSETHNLRAAFFFLYLVHVERRLWSQAFLAATVETGNKNHCLTEAMHVLQRKLAKD